STVAIPILATNSTASLSVTGQGTKGTASVSSGAINYTETVAGATQDTLTYSINRGGGVINSGQVTLTIVNASPLVSSTDDSGPGSLRAAIDQANAAPSLP